MLREFEKPFSGVNGEVLNGIQACSPTLGPIPVRAMVLVRNATALTYWPHVRGSNDLRGRREAGAGEDSRCTTYWILIRSLRWKILFRLPWLNSCSCKMALNALWVPSRMDCSTDRSKNDCGSKIEDRLYWQSLQKCVWTLCQVLMKLRGRTNAIHLKRNHTDTTVGDGLP